MKLTQHISCIHEPELALEIGNVRYYAACAVGVIEFKGGLVVNLSGKPNTPNTNTMPIDLIPHMDISYSEILVPWPDMELPRVKSSFWQAIHRYVEDGGHDEVCFHCEAGHGRTGTALSALSISNLGWSLEKSIETVRNRICRYMVETSEQCEYLAYLDNVYNDRVIDETNIPVPSMILMMEDLGIMSGD